jgi:hypothetical protein
MRAARTECEGDFRRRTASRIWPTPWRTTGGARIQLVGDWTERLIRQNRFLLAQAATARGQPQDNCAG